MPPTRSKGQLAAHTAISAGALLWAFGVPGCGQSMSQSRAAVAGYVKHVDGLERQIAGPLQIITKEGRVLAGAGAGSRAGALPNSGGASDQITQEHAGRVLAASRSLRDLGRRLAAIPAPPPARRLRSMLLALVSGQADLSRQEALLVVYTPALTAALRPLTPATGRLSAALSVTQGLGPNGVSAVFAAKVAALRGFDLTLDRIFGALRRLTPPPVSAPGYRSQFGAVTGMRRSAARLAAALAGGGSA